MLPEKLTEILQHKSPVAIATQGPDGPHLVNTWNSYIEVTDADTLLIPMGYMSTTEANLKQDPRVLITVASSDVVGTMGPGAGFLITGTAEVETSGAGLDLLKSKFAWARAAMEVTIVEAKQTL
jgi:predicted pyridoxine 5'-phosphate oxidase superfamily flavin-nucleotide-binding protein